MNKNHPALRVLFDFLMIGFVFFSIKSLLKWSNDQDSFTLLEYFKKEWVFVLFFAAMLAGIRYFQRRGRKENQ